jgi:hypothetical protein
MKEIDLTQISITLYLKPRRRQTFRVFFQFHFVAIEIKSHLYGRKLTIVSNIEIDIARKNTCLHFLTVFHLGIVHK